MSALLDYWPLLLSIMSVIAVIFQLKRFSQQSNRYRAKAKRVFLEVRHNLTNPKFGLDGRTAGIFMVGETLIGTDDNLKGIDLEMHVRNEYGEYFYVIARSSGSVYIKHITQAAAKAVLQEKYIPQTDVA